MFGLAIVAAAAAFVGAPSTPIHCNPDLPTGILGRTYFPSPSSPASLVELGQTACAGLLLLSSSARELQDIGALNGPSLNVAADEGIGIETLLMEEVHASRPYNPDETDDACRAMALLPEFLGRYLAADQLASALRWAGVFYASQPAATYHTHAC